MRFPQEVPRSRQRQSRAHGQLFLRMDIGRIAHVGDDGHAPHVCHRHGRDDHSPAVGGGGGGSEDGLLQVNAKGRLRVDRLHFMNFDLKDVRGVVALKDAVLSGADIPLSSALQIERKAHELMYGTQDMREGTNAFSEKRKPEFKGQ